MEIFFGEFHVLTMSFEPEIFRHHAAFLVQVKGENIHVQTIGTRVLHAEKLGFPRAFPNEPVFVLVSAVVPCLTQRTTAGVVGTIHAKIHVVVPGNDVRLTDGAWGGKIPQSDFEN